MAQAYPTSVNLRAKRSAQSGDYIMTVAWQQVYANSHGFAWLFLSGEIDLTNMAAGDTLEIRVSKRQTVTGAYILKDLMDFDGVQPTNHKKISIGPVMDTFGVQIEMRQTAVAAALITCNCEFFDATR